VCKKNWVCFTSLTVLCLLCCDFGGGNYLSSFRMCFFSKIYFCMQLTCRSLDNIYFLLIDFLRITEIYELLLTLYLICDKTNYINIVTMFIAKPPVKLNSTMVEREFHISLSTTESDVKRCFIEFKFSNTLLNARWIYFTILWTLVQLTTLDSAQYSWVRKERERERIESEQSQRRRVKKRIKRMNNE
jgi:hypothetical protein